MAKLDRNPKDDIRQRRAIQKLVANGGAAQVIAGENPTGTIDGSNDTFELNYIPAPGTLKVYRNGLKLREGADNDYTLAANVITFTPDAVPQVGSQLEVDYEAA